MSRIISNAGTMFEPEEIYFRYGDIVTENQSKEKYKPVEKFFIEVMDNYPTVTSYDVTADEPHYFYTTNYTTYAGFFSIVPLNRELARIAVNEAAAYGAVGPEFNYIDFLKDRVLNNQANKYNEICSKSKHDNAVALVVLPGTNIFDRFVEVEKLMDISLAYGKFALFKPHPLTTKEHLEAMPNLTTPAATFLDPLDDMYYYMNKVNEVYATHTSESPLYATILDKVVKPLDKHRRRLDGSISCYNNIIFNSPDPKYVINRFLNNYRSGLVDPDIHPDWQDRIVQYIDYIHRLREHFKGMYYTT